MGAEILDFNEAKEKQIKRAYDWARADMKKHNFQLKPIRINFDGDYFQYNEAECEVAIFCDKKKDIAILRRHWPGKLTTSYHYIVNYGEIKQIAPNSLNKLLENGIEVYKRDGVSKIPKAERKPKPEPEKDRKILYFEDAKEKQLREAFDWAVRDMEKHGFTSKPARFEFEGGDFLQYNEDRVSVVMFYDRELDWAILRRDWPEELLTSYNTVTNYAEIERIAPNSLKKLLENGIEMYNRYKRAGLAD